MSLPTPIENWWGHKRKLYLITNETNEVNEANNLPSMTFQCQIIIKVTKIILLCLLGFNISGWSHLHKELKWGKISSLSFANVEFNWCYRITHTYSDSLTDICEVSDLFHTEFFSHTFMCTDTTIFVLDLESP